MTPSQNTTWAPAAHASFLKNTPEDQMRQSSDPDGASFHFLVHVDSDLLDLMGADQEIPTGFYLLHVGDAGQADAEYFGEDFDAATRATYPWVADYLEGDTGDLGDTVAEDGYAQSTASTEPWQGEVVDGRLAKTAGETE